MRIKTIIILLFLNLSFFSQGVKEIYLKDKSTKIELAFATVYNYNLARGTITNTEGNCKVNYKSDEDKIIFQYLGYHKLILTAKNINNVDTIYLTQKNNNLKEFIVVAHQDQDFIAKMLRKVIKVNKKLMVSNKSKATLITESFINNKPLERQESIGNATVSINGVENYKVKIGRFGQNKSFNFYTLTATNLFSNFHVIRNRNDNDFPELITNLSKRKMKRRYELSYFKNPYGDENLMKIKFQSKNGEGFSGEVLFFTETKKLKEINFTINSPKEKIFVPVIKSHSVDVSKMTCKLSYSDTLSRLNYIKIDYELDYKTNKKHKISTSSILTFEDYKHQYSNAYYTGEINLRGEYHQILFNSFDERFWKENYLYSQSDKVSKTFEFFKKNGYVANFNQFSSDSIFTFLDLKLKNWDTTRLKMRDLNYNSKSFGIRENDMLGEKVRYSISELYNFEVNYYYNYFLYQDSSFSNIVKPVFNKNNSYYFLENNWSTSILLNIYFDIFEYHKPKLFDNYRINKRIIDKAEKESIKTAKMFLKNSERGKNTDTLVFWNEFINSNVGVNNFKKIEKIIKRNKNIIIKGFVPPNFYNIGTAYLHLKKYNKAIYYFNKECEVISYKFEMKNLNAEDVLNSDYSKTDVLRLTNTIFNRAQSYINLKKYEKACSDLQFAYELGDKESQKLLKKYCK